MPFATTAQGDIVATDHALRITVRIAPDAVDLHPDAPGLPPPEIELALPVRASIAEILPDILDLAGIPGHPGPWVASTAVGVPVETAVPLTHTALRQGGILVLSPGTVPEAPVLRDAAEVLADGEKQGSFRGLGTVAVAGGLIACTLLAVTGTVPGSDGVPPALRLAMLALLCVVVASRLSARRWDNDNDVVSTTGVLVVGAVASVSVAVISGILRGAAELTAGPDPAVSAAVVGGCLTGGVVLTVCWFCCRMTPALTAALGNSLFLVSLGACTLPFPGGYPGAAAATLALALIVVAVLPSVAVRVAGLTVPRLPPAGEDIGLPEDPAPDIDERARFARSVLSGALAGTSVVAGICVLIVGWSGGVFSAALCLATTVATVLHALRHRNPLAVWALWVWSLCAAVGVVLSGVLDDSVGVASVSSVVALTILTLPLWGPRVGELRPVAVNWLERLETLAVAVVLPLAAHILGVFILIRGL
ncbi:type VII secretion integral membrane protein EccD [Corynebacterium sp. CCM 9204]|uniref:type VII secretion integral membrane protein EccD n=1 Tax=Corynebacterium sp. CCM 9204 TaxID=3057616 RepID=UPI0035233038